MNSRKSIPTALLTALAGGALAAPPGDPAGVAPGSAGLPVGWSLMPPPDSSAGLGGGGVRVDPCFAEGTVLTPEVLEELDSLRGLGAPAFEERYFLNGQARNGGQRNVPVTVTYSYVPDGTWMRGGTMRSNGRDIELPDVGSQLFSNMDGRFGGNRDLWMYEMDSVFARYTELTGITFVRTVDDGSAFPASSGQAGVRGDLRIAMRPLDGRYNVLAFAGTHVTLDAEEDWGNNAGTFILLRNVLSHEVGHAIGLSHVCPLTHSKLMEPIFTGDFDGPRHDDLRGLQAVYGDAYEPNNGPAEAFVMTDSLPQTSFTFFNYPYQDGNFGATTAAVSDWADADWYRSTVGAQMPVSVTVTPAGATYDSSPQAEDGSCTSGNPVTTMAVTRLAVAIYGADGRTLLARAEAPALGAPAVLSGVSVPAGVYYTVVWSAAQDNAAPQGYTLTRSVGSPQAPANDLCADAQAFTSGPVTGTTFGAGAEGTAWLDLGGNSDPFNTRGDVYYTFTAAETGRIEAFTTNAGSPPGSGQAVTIHTGCPVTRANQLPIPDTRHYGMGSMYSDVVAGRTYTVRVGSAPNRDWGGFTLDLRYLNAPANDRCENATPVTTGTYPGTTRFARREGAGACATTDASPTVWYRYTAPYANTVTVTTCGSGWDTVLAAYAGCPFDAAHPLACNDDTPCGNYPYTSTVRVPVEAGRTVYFRVSGYAGGSGDFTLGVTEGPLRNDTCDTADPIAAGSTPFDSGYARTDGPAEAGCSFCCGDLQVGKDLWYAYTADRGGTLTVDTNGSVFDTKLAAYRSCPTGDSQAVACNDDANGGYQSWMRLDVTAGSRTLIRVGGYRDAAGPGMLNLSFEPAACPADFNRDGFLDFFDYDDFVACFETGSCPAGTSADFNRDGFADFFDYDDFVAAFEAGC